MTAFPPLFRLLPALEVSYFQFRQEKALSVQQSEKMNPKKKVERNRFCKMQGDSLLIILEIFLQNSRNTKTDTVNVIKELERVSDDPQLKVHEILIPHAVLGSW